MMMVMTIDGGDDDDEYDTGDDEKSRQSTFQKNKGFRVSFVIITIIIIIRIPFISTSVTDSVNATQMTCDYPTGERACWVQ